MHKIREKETIIRRLSCIVTGISCHEIVLEPILVPHLRTMTLQIWFLSSAVIAISEKWGGIALSRHVRSLEESRLRNIWQ